MWLLMTSVNLFGIYSSRRERRHTHTWRRNCGSRSVRWNFKSSESKKVQISICGDLWLIRVNLSDVYSPQISEQFSLKTVLVYEYWWVGNLVKETATLAFCIVVFYVFRLFEKDEYSVIGEKEEQVPEITVKE